MADIESEMEDGDTTDGDMEDAEDSFDEYKSENQIKEDKDPCWKGYEMIGMKKKGGRKVPNCVPVEEENKDVPFDMPTENPSTPYKNPASKAKQLARAAMKKAKSEKK
jgi:hypothetical protein